MLKKSINFDWTRIFWDQIYLLTDPAMLYNFGPKENRIAQKFVILNTFISLTDDEIKPRRGSESHPNSSILLISVECLLLKILLNGPTITFDNSVLDSVCTSYYLFIKILVFLYQLFTDEPALRCFIGCAQVGTTG